MLGQSDDSLASAGDQQTEQRRAGGEAEPAFEAEPVVPQENPVNPRLFLPIFLLLLSTGSVVSQARPAQSEADIKAAQEVLALEELWLQSQISNRPELAEPLMAEGFHATLADGSVIDREQDIASTPVKYLHSENRDVQTSVFGNTVIVRGGKRAKGLDADGKPFEVSYRFTDTWVKMPDGQWRCVATHMSPLQM